MITTDTNVIIRLLTRDDVAQYEQAYRLFQAERVFIPTTVALETEWVLRFAYDFAPSRIVAALRSLFGLPAVELEQPRLLAEVLDWYAAGLDFADALHLAAARKGDRFVTFDKRLVARAKKLVNLPVEMP